MARGWWCHNCPLRGLAQQWHHDYNSKCRFCGHIRCGLCLADDIGSRAHRTTKQEQQRQGHAGIAALQGCEGGQSGCGIGGSVGGGGGAGRGASDGGGGGSGGVDTIGGMDDFLTGQGDLWMGKEQMDFDLDMLTWGDGDGGKGESKMEDGRGGL